MNKVKRYEIIIAGRGGQGILLAGYLMGRALIEKGYYVVNSETYSAETRGGDSRSELVVTIGEEPDLIRIRKADIAIFMFDEQMEKYSKWVKDEALVILDSTYIKEPYKPWKEVYSFPFSRLAEEELGSIRVANMVMLGSFSAITGLYDIDTVKRVTEGHVKEQWKEINLKAIQLGYEIASNR
jgi:2-oxoglutarate ferredoxin oxidoreductase subunit gamma